MCWMCEDENKEPSVSGITMSLRYENHGMVDLHIKSRITNNGKYCSGVCEDCLRVMLDQIVNSKCLHEKNLFLAIDEAEMEPSGI